VVEPDILAIFGRTATPDSALHDGDRVEVLRPLRADPKQARRERAKTGGRN
jgi:putative ubiquitin-RnfH superfamily antitoxin RatB of RatAB toxin-antitoxin module